jgi:general secretion pathway protein I
MRTPQHGFTLIEVLVATAIVAVALGAGLKAAGVVVDSTQRFTEVSAAQWCADNQLAELKLSRQFPGIGDSEFTCEQLGRQYRGTVAVQSTPNSSFRRVDVQMNDAAGQPLLTLSTVLPRY